MGIEIYVREAVKEDLSDIVKLIESFNNEIGCFASVGGVNSDVLKGQLLTIWEILKIWVCVENEEIISVLAMLEFNNPFSGMKALEELFWYSKPKARGKKCSLLEQMEKYAEQEDVFYTQMGLMNSTTNTDTLAKYYSKHGYNLHQFQYVKQLKRSMK